ncbi:MAG TPA: urea carboxylase-associated family protein, partial [Alphaproteobacteria bacterium]|nr:urea carboxylase-associated family protein [Alphaproteobacteria bacterium]
MTRETEIAGVILRDDTVPPGRPWSGVIRRGERLRIVDLEGNQGVDFLCYNAADTAERYHAPNTLKAAKTLKLTTG